MSEVKCKLTNKVYKINKHDREIGKRKKGVR